jgi:hypothetical protein
LNKLSIVRHASHLGPGFSRRRFRIVAKAGRLQADGVRSELFVIVILGAGCMWHHNQVRVDCSTETAVEKHDNSLLVATMLQGSEVQDW